MFMLISRFAGFTASIETVPALELSNLSGIDYGNML
jgi:hypothetical protein